jgi:hypothetical protein
VWLQQEFYLVGLGLYFVGLGLYFAGSGLYFAGWDGSAAHAQRGPSPEWVRGLCELRRTQWECWPRLNSKTQPTRPTMPIMMLM